MAAATAVGRAAASPAPSTTPIAGRRVEGGTVHAIATDGKIGGPFVRQQNAPFIKRRLEVFERLYTAQQQRIEADREKEVIRIVLPDGSERSGRSWETTPMDIASSISADLAGKVVVAKVAFHNPLEEDEGGAALAAADDDEEEEAGGGDEDDEEGCRDDGDSRSCHNDTTESGGRSSGAAAKAAGLKLRWRLWDCLRPFEASCHLRLLKFDDEEGKNVFWHSSAHVLGQCLEEEFGSHLTVGPALESGFYYDSYMGEQVITTDDFEALVRRAEAIAKAKAPFQRLVCTKEEALEMFKGNVFKERLIQSKVPEGGRTSCYRCGSFVDLCRGPHIPYTSLVQAFSVLKTSSAYWLGKASLDSLQRVYAISFPTSKQLKEYNRLVEEAAKRDHRTLGNSLNLFFFDTNVSAGSCFWLPDGARVYNKLCDFMRSEYRIRGFQEVITPNIYSCDLWKTSGHYQNYKDSMYLFDIEGKEWGLKPMNCPGHCIMFRHLNPSYRQLPIRLADFGVLHRNELSGSLTGLTRVRRFQQDDAHIFCTMEQIQEEVKAALEFLFFTYEQFGFTFDLKLSTRPKKALGTKEVWKKAEEALRLALEATGRPWSLNPGDGAFYGPKVDIRLSDALKRQHQCGTIQLDFQLPIRFNLQYKTHDDASAAGAATTTSTATSGGSAPTTASSSGDLPPNANDDGKREEASSAHRLEDGPDNESSASGQEQQQQLQPKKGEAAAAAADEFVEQPLRPGMARPVIIHRAILGSIERMCAVIVEHTAGKLPFWLSPRQAIVLPISDKSAAYARWVKETLHSFGYDVGVDESNNTINKKIREAQLAQWNFLLVVGEKEMADGTVTVRRREDSKAQQTLKVEQVLEEFASLAHSSSKIQCRFSPWSGRTTDDVKPKAAEAVVP